MDAVFYFATGFGGKLVAETKISNGAISIMEEGNSGNFAAYSVSKFQSITSRPLRLPQ